ncbi:MAG TPA: RNA polymerase sigma factor [Tepidisphaeraceae bacterium]|nr:RNA polymerase sigma factor [Tepidisphaeraceae bacterium]
MNLRHLCGDYVHVSDSGRAMGGEVEAIQCELLVLRCRRNDPDAWREMVGLFERRLLYYIRRLLGDPRDAWDALQQTWMEVFRNLRTLQNPRALRPWLYRIAHRRAISLRRATTCDLPEPDGSVDVEQLADEPADADWNIETAQQIHRALDRLSLPHRQVITLFFLEEMPIDEIADVVGVPPGTVKSRLHYAKLALRRLLEAESS